MEIQGRNRVVTGGAGAIAATADHDRWLNGMRRLRERFLAGA